MALRLREAPSSRGLVERVDLDGRHLTGRVLRWMANFDSARVLHVFERSVNLVSAQGEVLSIVDPSIGPGPFNLVLSQTVDFQRTVPADTEVSVRAAGLKVGKLEIRLAGAETWNPVPDWGALASSAPPRRWLALLDEERRVGRVQPAIRYDPPPDPGDEAALMGYAGALAGLGPGLTPSGDDVLMGLMHAYFVRFPEGVARERSAVIARIAVPRTTSLSGAWLYAAAEGEAGVLWHRLVDAAAAGNDPELRAAVRAILAVGHTSGADALSGFAAGLV